MRFVKVGVLSVLAIDCLAAPVAAGAPSAARLPRIGILQVWSEADPVNRMVRQALADVGFAEGRTIAIESRWAEGKAERLPVLATELVRLKVDAFVVFGDPAIRAAQQATRTIPVVAVTDDMVGAGLVQSLARPGGNVTGVSILASELNAKRLQLLKEAVPRASRIAALWDSGSGSFHLQGLQAAARSLGVDLQILEVRQPDDFTRALKAANDGRAEGLVVLASPFLHAYRETLIDLAAKNRLPAIYQWRETAEAGGLLSYGPRLPDVMRQCAGYLERILKGANPADLPVEQPTRFELVINLKTAKGLGLTIPQSILIRADQVIQ